MLINYPKLSNYIIRGYVIANYTVYNKAIMNCNFRKEAKFIRKNILKYKKEIFKNNIYPKKVKLQTILLLFGKNVYKLFFLIYKLFKLH